MLPVVSAEGRAGAEERVEHDVAAGKARMSREVHVKLCEELKVKLLRPTPQNRRTISCKYAIGATVRCFLGLRA